MNQASALKAIAYRCAESLRKLRCDAKGNTMTMFALAAIPMVGTVGIGLDVAQWVLWKRQLHSSADLAALAGASANSQGQDIDKAIRRSLAHNDLRDFQIMKIEFPPTVGSYAGDSDAVRVVLQTQQVLPFSSVFLRNPPIVDAEAIAIAKFESPNCVIALDTANSAISITGSASVNMNCAMTSNSNFAATSSDSINAAALSAVGTVTVGAAVTADTKINNGADMKADPYAGKVTIPDLTSECSGASWFTNRSNRVDALTPGCYSGITVRGELTLAPGTYYIDEGNVETNSGAILKGTGVTIIFTSSDPSSTSIGKYSAAGNSTTQLSAPSTGDYAGLLMYQDARAVAGTKTNFFMTGTSGTDNAGNLITSEFQGAIYTPSTKTHFQGNSSISTPCMQIVAKTVEFSGNTTVENNCPVGSGASSFGGGKFLRLVE